MRGIFLLAEELLASQEGLYSMDFVSWPSLIVFSPVSDMHTVMTLCNKARTCNNQFILLSEQCHLTKPVSCVIGTQH
jgi:hypothetical protein